MHPDTKNAIFKSELTILPVGSVEQYHQVLDGINTLQNNTVIPNNTVGNDTKIQELPINT